MTDKTNEQPIAATDSKLTTEQWIKGLTDYVEARKKANRILAVCNNDENGLEDVLKAIRNEGEINALVVMILALGEARVYGRIARANKSNAKQKGEIWREAAIEQWNQNHAEYKSLADFCGSITGSTLKNESGQTQPAPGYRQVYNVMLAARKAGKLKV